MIITLELKPINIQLLQEELQASLQHLYLGIVTNEQLHINMADDARWEDGEIALGIVENHDNTKMTAKQAKQANQEATITQGRLDYTVPLNPNSITLQELAERIMWLEAEIRHREGL